MEPNQATLNIVRSGSHWNGQQAEVFWAPVGAKKKRKRKNGMSVNDKNNNNNEEEDDDVFMTEQEEKEKEREDGEDADQCGFEDDACDDPEEALYVCPDESCGAEFLLEANLDKHILLEQHNRRPERITLRDYSLKRYSSFLEVVLTPPSVSEAVNEAVRSLGKSVHNGVKLSMGWALPKKRSSKRFASHVKEFLKDIYMEGDRTGVKTDPRAAERKMRLATLPDGSMQFKSDELLNSRQIAGVFSSLKKTKIDAREKGKKPRNCNRRKNTKNMGCIAGNLDSRSDEVLEEDEDEEDVAMDELLQQEGDYQLDFEDEPLFNVEDEMTAEVTAMASDLGLDMEAVEQKEKKEEEGPQMETRHSKRRRISKADDLF